MRHNERPISWHLKFPKKCSQIRKWLQLYHRSTKYKSSSTTQNTVQRIEHNVSSSEPAFSTNIKFSSSGRHCTHRRTQWRPLNRAISSARLNFSPSTGSTLFSFHGCPFNVDPNAGQAVKDMHFPCQPRSKSNVPVLCPLMRITVEGQP